MRFIHSLHDAAVIAVNTTVVGHRGVSWDGHLIMNRIMPRNRDASFDDEERLPLYTSCYTAENNAMLSRCYFGFHRVPLLASLFTLLYLAIKIRCCLVLVFSFRVYFSFRLYLSLSVSF